uniref:ML domain-containing protein n=1 Tax=Steinernema glaseri TaxID=37863 RepID=A0A1I7YYA5_9BILA
MSKMMYRLAAVVLLLAFTITEAKPSRFNTCGFPNSTDVNPNTYSCNTDAPMQVIKTRILDQVTKKPVYPINPQKPIIIDLTAINHGIQYNDNKANVKVYSYTSDWLTGNCKWVEIPTFGLLDQIDGCQMAHNCPLQPGNLDLQLPLDLSKYAAIINLLASNTAYQLHIEMFDYNQGSKHEQIACVVAQVHFI